MTLSRTGVRSLPALLLAACSGTPCPVPAAATASKPQASASVAVLSPSSKGPDCLSLATWNDLHGQLGPDDPSIDTGRLPAGGVIALADQLAEIRATGDAVVTIEAGDQWTGPLEATVAEGAPVVVAYNLMHVDAVTLGNHDFDFGPVGYDRVVAKPGVTDEAGADGPRGALLARMGEATFPFLSANVRRVGGAPTGWSKHRASVRIARDGFEVGVVGYTTRDTPATTLRPNVADLDFTDVANVARAIRELRAAGASPVVLTAHASIDGQLPQSLDDTHPHPGEMTDVVAALGKDVPDVIVAGHRHAWLTGRVGGVPIVSSDQHGVGLARIRFCRRDGRVELRGIERRVALAPSQPTTELGAKVAAAMAPWQARVKADADTTVATIPRTCMPQALDGTAYAEQVARAIAEHATDAAQPAPGVPIVAINNAGGLRAPLLAGTVRFTDLFTAFPFENGVAVCGTTRAGLEQLLRNAIARPTVHERFPFGIAGAKATLKRLGDGGLSLTSVVIDGGRSARPGDPVWIAVPDFVLWGGDGLLNGVACSPTATSATRVRDAWRALLAREQGGCDGTPKNVVVQPR